MESKTCFSLSKADPTVYCNLEEPPLRRPLWKTAVLHYVSIFPYVNLFWTHKEELGCPKDFCALQGACVEYGSWDVDVRCRV